VRREITPEKIKNPRKRAENGIISRYYRETSISWSAEIMSK